MRTVLVGRFEDGLMIEARPGKIVAERCRDGIKEIKVSVTKSVAPTFKYKRTTRLNIVDQPTVMDPFEKNIIYIKESEWGDDGLFTKKDIEANEVVSYYSGIFWNETEMELFPDNQTSYEM